jgi:L-ribulose-5-phosphate 3-epimerase
MMSRRDMLSRAAILAAAAGAARSGLAQQGQIKPAVLITMLPKELSYLERFQLATDIGFHNMEVQTLDGDDEAHKVKEAADKAGLRIHSVMNMRHWEYPLSSPDPKDVEMSLEGMRTSLRQAKLYGADTVLLVPAVVREDTTYEQAWERSQQQVRKLIPDAEKANVSIALEEVWNKFLLTPRDFVQYVDEFKHPLVKAYFDVGNVVHYGVPQQWIRALGKRIAKVHLKDYSRRNGFVNLGDGDINWPEVRKAFADVGYTGVATTELRGGDREYLTDVYQRVQRLLGLSNS